MIPKECRRLADVDFPIAVVSKHSAREKSIRHGHPLLCIFGGRGDRWRRAGRCSESTLRGRSLIFDFLFHYVSYSNYCAKLFNWLIHVKMIILASRFETYTNQ